MVKKKKQDFQSLKTLFDKYEVKEDKGYITKEFQDYGLRLAVKLNDKKHKGLYIKMAKEVDRSILERALRFVVDSAARSKAKLFMWKVKQLREEKEEKDE
jgi:hypothetical protein